MWAYFVLRWCVTVTMCSVAVGLVCLFVVSYIIFIICIIFMLLCTWLDLSYIHYQLKQVWVYGFKNMKLFQARFKTRWKSVMFYMVCMLAHKADDKNSLLTEMNQRSLNDLCVPASCREIYQTWPVTWTLFGIYGHCQNMRPVLAQPETQTHHYGTSALHLHLRHLADTLKKETIRTFLAQLWCAAGPELLQHDGFNHTWASCCQEMFWIDLLQVLAVPKKVKK